MRSDLYQLSLLFLIVVAVLFFAVFFHREIAPEYRVYQDAYVELEKFRSSLTGEPPAFFKIGVKQIVIPKSDEGPETIDRCTSCHVALDLQHFSPTKIAHDVNGNILYDAQGIPEKVPNENYIFTQLEKRAAELPKKEARHLRELATVDVNGRTIPLDKVLVMHPLIGKETRPFEFHPIDDYGCTSCHNGNGRALTSDKAHGPVFDGAYEESYEGPKPHFTESDPENDPLFSRIFNHKPGHELLFQTTPVFVGGLVEANCVQCHQSAKGALQTTLQSVGSLKSRGQDQLNVLQTSYESALKEGLVLSRLLRDLTSSSYDATYQKLIRLYGDASLSREERNSYEGQLKYLKNTVQGVSENERTAFAKKKIRAALSTLLGSDQLVDAVQEAHTDTIKDFTAFVESHKADADADGTLFKKAEEANLRRALLEHIGYATRSFENVVDQDNIATAMTSDIDLLTTHFQNGKDLYLSQACYACHRIAGYARGGVGPELTREGNSYPWFIKESIVWPQADLRTSTMPNMRLDHEELEDLVTFLLAQKGITQSISEVDYRVGLKEWENGKKLPWEQPLKPSQMRDLVTSMTIFATEGCASCHRLKGFASDVGYTVEKQGEVSWEQLWKEREWFENIFPELLAGNDIPGSVIVERLDKYAKEIDEHIANNVRSGSIIEKIEREYPGSIEALYSNFKFASRAKNHAFETQIAAAASMADKEALTAEWKLYKDRVRRVLMTYIQEYGLGRLIGPRPNWSGIFRSDEWLMEHFANPSAHTAKSIMPAMPFDETKFYALTYMLDTLAQRNLKWIRSIWDHKGFNPELAYQLQCAQCHGENEQRADAPVATWIYPPPKNLRNSIFLRNLTPERVRDSIHFGVKGTPMPPWAECASGKEFENIVPVMKFGEVEQMVDWLFRSLPAETSLEKGTGVLKWKYTPEDAVKELQQEGDELKSEDNKSPEHAATFGARSVWSAVGSATAFRSEPSSLYQSGGRARRTPNASRLPSWLSGLDKVQGYVAEATPQKNALTVDNVFDVVPSPVPGGVDQDAYYIKKKYYTPDNIAEGQRLFVTNCSVCHGKEGAGNGARAGSMVEAKPRMLTNLDWIRTRDDLRLLRSIKYGVPGTAMTPWGDLTSGLQRMQMVMFIRTLSEEKSTRYRLSSSLYHAFDTSTAALRREQAAVYEQVDGAAAAYQKARDERQKKDDEAVNDPALVEQASLAHQKELQALNQLRRVQSLSDAYSALINAIEEEAKLYEVVGANLIARKQSDAVLEPLLEAIRLSGERFRYQQGTVKLVEESAEEQRVLDEILKVAQQLDVEIAARQKAGDTNSPTLKGLQQLKNEVLELTGDIQRVRSKELDLFQKLRSQQENISLPKTSQTESIP